MWDQIGFWIAAVISVSTALVVVIHPNPVRSALFLVLNFVCLAFLYMTLNAQLLAALQVLVYAGAIMVLFLFVIMLLNLTGEQTTEDPLPGQRGAAALLGLLLIGGLAAAVNTARQLETSGAPAVVQDASVDQVQQIGLLLMSRYVYPFELTSALLLVGIIGSVLLAQKRLPAEKGTRNGS